MMIMPGLLLTMLATLSTHELREVYGLSKLELPWVAVELVIHAMVVRRLMSFEVPQDLHCIEVFAGTQTSSQVAKAFEEMGFASLAFDILRNWDQFIIYNHWVLSEGRIQRSDIICLLNGTN